MHRLSFHHHISIVILLLLFFGGGERAYCHPHAFVVTSYDVVFNDQGVEGIGVSWTFDEMYSATTALDFDSDGDGRFSKEEGDVLVGLGKQFMPEQSYFTNIHIDGKPFQVRSVEDFSITYENGVLKYTFFVDCPIEATEQSKVLKISPHDKEFYLAMFFDQEQPVNLVNAEQHTVTTTVGEDKDTLIFFDSMHPVALRVEFQVK